MRSEQEIEKMLEAANCLLEQLEKETQTADLENLVCIRERVHTLEWVLQRDQISTDPAYYEEGEEGLPTS